MQFINKSISLNAQSRLAFLIQTKIRAKKILSPLIFGSSEWMHKHILNSLKYAAKNLEVERLQKERFVLQRQEWNNKNNRVRKTAVKFHKIILRGTVLQNKWPDKTWNHETCLESLTRYRLYWCLLTKKIVRIRFKFVCTLLTFSQNNIL